MSKLIDIVKNGGYTDAAVGIIDEVTKNIPEINFFDARLINGTQFKSLYKDGLPTAAFREVNKGVAASRSSFGLRTFDLGILAGLCVVDKAEAQASCANGVQSVEAFLADQATDLVVSGMKALADKVWYGSASGTEKFDGVSNLVTSDLTVDAGGTTTDKCSSVYAVGNDATKGCGLVFAANSGFFLKDALEWNHGTASDGTNEYPTYWTDLTGWAGFSAVDSRKMARLANLNATDGKTLTDALLADLVNTYREANNGMNPSALFTTFAQLRALQKARATNYPAVRGTKAEIYAPFPTDFEGIPLIATTSIVDTEAVVA